MAGIKVTDDLAARIIARHLRDNQLSSGDANSVAVQIAGALVAATNSTNYPQLREARLLTPNPSLPVTEAIAKSVLPRISKRLQELSDPISRDWTALINAEVVADIYHEIFKQAPHVPDDVF